VNNYCRGQLRALQAVTCRWDKLCTAASTAATSEASCSPIWKGDCRQWQACRKS